MSSEKIRVYILVKTYPTISKTHSELVCTAGIKDDGTWVRLYPIPFRKLDYTQQYPKYSLIEANVEKNDKDFRPESYKLSSKDSIKVIERDVSSPVDWGKRWSILKNTKIYNDLSILIAEAKNKEICRSLAMFKPTEIIGFVIEVTDREWDKDKLVILENLSRYGNLFQTPEEVAKEFEVVEKIPYKFSYKFKDVNGKESTLMIEDWEIGALYLNCIKAGDTESIACQKVKAKYLADFTKKDIYFFLGTTLSNHYLSRNPFIIIGLFYPPQHYQHTLI